MKYELLLRGRAKADIRRAAKWYERQREGLGREFVAEVDSALGIDPERPILKISSSETKDFR